MGPQDIIDNIAEINPEAVVWNGFDEAVIGVGERCGLGPVLIYSQRKMIEILMDDECTEEDALEYIQYNVLGSYVGEYTPIVMVDEL